MRHRLLLKYFIEVRLRSPTEAQRRHFNSGRHSSLKSTNHLTMASETYTPPHPTQNKAQSIAAPRGHNIQTCINSFHRWLAFYRPFVFVQSDGDECGYKRGCFCVRFGIQIQTSVPLYGRRPEGDLHLGFRMLSLQLRSSFRPLAHHWLQNLLGLSVF